MEPQPRAGQEAESGLLTIGQEIPDRLELSPTPGPDLVAHFVMTRAAEQAWATVNRQLAARAGGFVWLGGAPCSGKTHFLNYVIALSTQAGELGLEPGRRLTLVVGATTPVLASELERGVAGTIAHELHSAGGPGALWRQLGGTEALRVILDQAKRRGVRLITCVIDLGEVDPSIARPGLERLAGLATTLRNPRLSIIAAGREREPGTGIETFTVDPAPDEFAAVALGRARRLADPVTSATVTAYDSIRTSERHSDEPAPERFFPFHPASVTILVALGDPTRPIPTIARIAREALLEWRSQPPPRGLIWPADLMDLRALRLLIESRLGASGREALARARVAAGAMDGKRGALARETVELLALYQLAGDPRPHELHTLDLRLGSSDDELADAIAELTVRSRGIIVLEPPAGAVRFNPRAAGDPEVAAYNAALPLIRSFDAASPIAETEELAIALERLRLALAAALEAATHNRATLARAVEESGGAMSAERERVFAQFIAIAEAGPAGLLSLASNPASYEACARTLSDYEALAALTAAMPRIRAMREYLLGMGLHEILDDDPQRDAATAKIETDCKLLLVAVNAATQAKTPAVLDALESRFQRFKWTYVPFYRAAHERYRLAMQRTALLADDVERHLAALRRLNAIPALGAPEGAALALPYADLARRVVRCQLDGPLTPEVAPRCLECNYVIGTPSPQEELTDLFAQVRHALEAKLAVLSQSAVARLIQEHDHRHRLEGFLKITQAAQTDALIRVFDDSLARYLTSLLEENFADRGRPAAGLPATPAASGPHAIARARR